LPVLSQLQVDYISNYCLWRTGRTNNVETGSGGNHPLCPWKL